MGGRHSRGTCGTQWITQLAISRAPLLPRTDEIVTDTAVLCFAIGICVLTTVLFGSLPACRAPRIDPIEVLRAASRGSTDTLRGGRMRASLVAAEVALRQWKAAARPIMTPAMASPI